MTADTRLNAPAAQRNAEPILRVVEQVLPERGLVLEIASGTGEHAAHFARRLPNLVWQPSDPDAQARASIDAWAADARLANLRPALALDACDETWDEAGVAAVLCINMIHIAPWAATLGLLAGAARVLDAGGPLVLYGPFMRGGRHTAPSNERFDASLRARNADWGVRDLDAVAAEAEMRGLDLDRAVEMPANNLTAVFRKR